MVIRVFKAFADISDASRPLEFLGTIDIIVVLYNTFSGITLTISDFIIVSFS